MGKRDQARSEAAFMRGETGVDGQATETETKDLAELEQDKAREQLLRGGTWLGREFLTWLLWRSESGDPVLSHQEEDLVVQYTGRVILRGVHGEVVELSAKGTLAPYSVHVKRALADGLLVHTARLHLTLGERTWEATLDAEFLDVRSAKLPQLLTEEEDDRLTERLDLVDQLSGMLDALVADFVALRGSKAWAKKVVPQLEAWMRGAQPDEGSTVERARRAAS
ncbi:MAG: hypothetical protein M3Y59_10380 [Myxococcota bacterium]|nr:hypothetical protein [Myxococcota bacterium]